MNRSHFCIVLTIWLAGMLLGFLFQDANQVLLFTKTLPLDFEMKPMFGLPTNFLGLFVNNLIVGLIIIVSGWLSAGSFACIISFWNAFIVGFLINAAQHVQIDNSIIINKIIWHGSLEILALIIFGAVGLRGYKITLAMMGSNSLDLQYKQTISQVIFSTSLLLIAAIIESNII